MNYILGKSGEGIVENYLTKERKFQIIKCRYKKSCGEIDIIAIEDSSDSSQSDISSIGTVIFIEVKSTTKDYVDFENTISKKQWRRIFDTAEQFFLDSDFEKYHQYNCRFDSIFIKNAKIVNHFENIIIDDFLS